MSTGTLYSQGVPDDLEATHLVVGMDGYYATVPRQTTSTIIVVVVLMLVVFCFLLIAFGFYWSDFNATAEVSEAPAPVVPVRPVDLTPGRGNDQTIAYASSFDGKEITSEAACTADPNAFWSTFSNSCLCRSPYWSGDCKRESYNPGYISAGVIKPDDIELSVLSVSQTPQLSYSQDPAVLSCTGTCDAIGLGCAGVFWEADTQTCTTFSEARLKANRRPVLNPAVDSNLYLNNWRLKLTEEVVIFRGQRPPDLWWNTGTSSVFQVAKRGIRYRLNFFPENVYNTTTMTGLYSRVPFKVTEFATLVAAGDDALHYVAVSGQPLRVPLSWGELPVWVMYDFYP